MFCRNASISIAAVKFRYQQSLYRTEEKGDRVWEFDNISLWFQAARTLQLL
ncbi:MAG: hypothetical protein RM022_025585 [Nostoc sp. EfeVER01]|uniref:hypothetical protein n=1 Tax=unclassified Nostoc TaxID=2593658 RepID=UPI002AD1E392|nr:MULTISPECIES: hypothetical protein [unclassified Nostoc]MDZ7948519.1 hypothetical protein [Nostoc sp. EfeVER01]MDZ7992151.1 hypothetical protein [Nostoc sp. EspVER01]